MRRSRPSLLNKVVQVEFIDHCTNSVELIECIAFGRVILDEADRITVRTWECPELLGDTKDENEESFCIARKLITRIKVLK